MLIAVLFSCNVLSAQTYVKAPDGTTIFTIDNSNKIYLGEGYDLYRAQLQNDVLDVSDVDEDIYFKNNVLYFDNVAILKTIDGKSYIFNDDGEAEIFPFAARKDNIIYGNDGDQMFSFSKTVSDNMQSTIIFFLIAIGMASE